MSTGVWQSIATVPKDGTKVDLWYEGRRLTNMSWGVTSPMFPSGYWERENDQWWDAEYTNPTHWMPIPDAPEVEHEL